MTNRIAEFDDLDDANRFRRMKGAADYEVVAGINFAWAVMPKIQYASNLGHSSEPPNFDSYVHQDREDDE